LAFSPDEPEIQENEAEGDDEPEEPQTEETDERMTGEPSESEYATETSESEPPEVAEPAEESDRNPLAIESERMASEDPADRPKKKRKSILRRG